MSSSTFRVERVRFRSFSAALAIRKRIAEARRVIAAQLRQDFRVEHSVERIIHGQRGALCLPLLHEPHDLFDHPPAEVQPCRAERLHEACEYCHGRLPVLIDQGSSFPTRPPVHVYVPELQRECPVEHLVGYAHGGLVHVYRADEHQVVRVVNARSDTIFVCVAAVQLYLAVFKLHRAENRRQVLLRVRQVHLVEHAYMGLGRILCRANQESQELGCGVSVLTERVDVPQ